MNLSAIKIICIGRIKRFKERNKYETTDRISKITAGY